MLPLVRRLMTRTLIPVSTDTQLCTIVRKNIRSWLTGINDINDCSTQAGDNLADTSSLRMTNKALIMTKPSEHNGNL